MDGISASREVSDESERELGAADNKAKRRAVRDILSSIDIRHRETLVQLHPPSQLLHGRHRFLFPQLPRLLI